MRIGSGVAIIILFAAGISPATCLAANKADPPASGGVYPYKDLPGVTVPSTATDDGLKCHTAPGETSSSRDGLDDGVRQLGYVCEQNGVTSFGNRQPSRGYWLYNDQTR
jgi:hypothetical protein